MYLLRVSLLLAMTVGTAFGADSRALDQAFERMYNADFSGAHRLLTQQIGHDPEDPLPYSVRAAAYLFGELDRLMILEGEFFSDDRRISEKKKLKADPAVRAAFYQAVADAQRLAKAKLAADPKDKNALFSLCIAGGVVTDYMALIEKKQIGSLSYAKEAHNNALRLLAADPTFYDAYLTTGLSEYLLGSLPFFVKWFVRFDQTQGSKTQAVHNLELVAAKGRYFSPFAKILLAVIHLREKRPRESERYLAELAKNYPGNPLYVRELDKVREKVRGSDPGNGGLE